jgi:hypothetical protein
MTANAGVTVLDLELRHSPGEGEVRFGVDFAEAVREVWGLDLGFDDDGPFVAVLGADGVTIRKTRMTWSAVTEAMARRSKMVLFREGDQR